MSQDATTIALVFMVLGIFAAYALMLRQEIQRRVHKARQAAARLARDRAVELVRHHASVAPPNYQTMYSNLATRLEEMSLE